MTLATEADAVREWAWNVGYEDHYINQQWICSNYDTWERNPHYTGPEQAHPEDDQYNYGDYAGEYPANLEDAYFDAVAAQDLISNLKKPVVHCLSFCERDMNRNEIPF